MHIRPVRESDAARLLEIYGPYVTDLAVSFEYELPTIEEFTERIRSISSRYPYLVLEDEGTICGYAYAHAFKERAAYDWSVESTIYLDLNVRRKGYGRLLYTELEHCLKKQGIINVNACITYAREDNTHISNDSMYFHEKMGYALVGTFHNSGYKFGQWYDMIWMEKMLSEHPDKADPIIPWPKLIPDIYQVLTGGR